MGKRLTKQKRNDPTVALKLLCAFESEKAQVGGSKKFVISNSFVEIRNIAGVTRIPQSIKNGWLDYVQLIACSNVNNLEMEKDWELIFPSSLHILAKINHLLLLQGKSLTFYAEKTFLPSK